LKLFDEIGIGLGLFSAAYDWFILTEASLDNSNEKRKPNALFLAFARTFHSTSAAKEALVADMNSGRRGRAL
jgi:hypothetical protein